MLVKWASDGAGGCLCIPIIAKGADGKDSPAISRDNMVMLFEGWGEIPIDKWEGALPSIKDKIEDGRLELRCKKETDAEGNTVYIQQPIYEVRADLAREIIKGCYNAKTLTEWSADPKCSAELRNLADIQLKACEDGAAPGKKK